MTPRAVHPVAWWVWGLLLGAAAIRITNPWLSGLLIASIWIVVAARRGETPWSRSFGRFLRLGAIVLVVRLVLQVLFAPRVPGYVVLTLPAAELPSWMAGVSLGGPVSAEALLGAFYESLRLLGLLAAIGAANSLANPYRLLRAAPAALYEMAVAVSVALSLAPQAGVAAARVRDARRLRGRPTRGLAAIRGVALPVLEGALERSVSMAASMDARGFGRATPSPHHGGLARGASVVGLALLCVGTYGLLDAGAPSALGLPAALGGAFLLAAAVFVGRPRSSRTRYRPDPWTSPEWLTVISGATVLAALVVAARLGIDLGSPIRPLGPPGLPLLPAAAVLLAAVPALATPEPSP